MVFTLLICADICGHKLNCEIPFAAPPTLTEVKQRADQVFFEEAQQLNRLGRLTHAAAELLATTVVPPGFDMHGQYSESGLLSLGRIQVYDDSMLRWVDLVSPNQLHEYDQIYVFPKHRAHLSQVRDLPPPMPTGAAVARTQVGEATSNALAKSIASANRGNASAAPSGLSLSPSRFGGTNTNINTLNASGLYVPPQTVRDGVVDLSPSRRTNPRGATLLDNTNNTSFAISVEELDKRQRQVFRICDAENHNYISVADFRSLFNRTKVLFNDVTVTEIFAMHSANGRFMTFSEFQIFSRHFPQLFAAIYRRLTETQAETDMANELELGAKRALGLRDEHDELVRRLEAIKRELEAQEKRTREVAAQLEQSKTSRGHVEEEEQVVLEKEVRIHFQREMLSREEHELKAATRRLDERSAAAASRHEVRRY